MLADDFKVMVATFQDGWVVKIGPLNRTKTVDFLEKKGCSSYSAKAAFSFGSYFGFVSIQRLRKFSEKKRTPPPNTTKHEFF